MLPKLRVVAGGEVKGEWFGTVHDCTGCWVLWRTGGAETGGTGTVEKYEENGARRCSGVSLALPYTLGPGGTGAWYEGAAPVNGPLVGVRGAVTGRTNLVG